MERTSTTPGLDLVERSLLQKQKESKKRTLTYYVPSLWLSPKGTPKRVAVDPFDFYLDAIKAAKVSKPPHKGESTGGEWSKDSVIYNMFVRTTAAFDHNGNGKLDLPVNSDGFRETGTFLKAIAMLPYIRSLGANTVHLLPITSIGHDGNKGTLGSPYAIRNPYELDENQGEPGLGVDVKTQFKAFVEAAHRLGLRVVLEFVFRTAAKDADWVKEHPGWFYWIKDGVEQRDPLSSDETKYGSPVFTPGELEQIHRDVHEHRLDKLIPPHDVYRNFFAAPPPAKSVKKEGGRYIGRLPDGTRVKIPGAFADWPPDDSQPPWGDVTYLRLYEHPEFNYIAYNTIRMYDSRLTQVQHINKPLWERIVGIIPYYQQEFQIDGVMIDMGHALPMELKSRMVKAARDINPDFAFWDENFSITQRSREEGYNAVFGFLWVDEHHLARIKNFLRRCASEGFPIPFFATPESHNTPRAAARPGGLAYAKWAMVINSFFPGIPFIHSGYELAEKYPINTGLDFTKEELKHHPSEKLPLFSDYAYNWLNKEQFGPWVTRVLAVREKYKYLVVDPRVHSFVVLPHGHDHLLAFARVSEADKKRIAIVGNANFVGQESGSLPIDTSRDHVVDLLTRERIPLDDHHISYTFQPGQCLVFEY